MCKLIIVEIDFEPLLNLLGITLILLIILLSKDLTYFYTKYLVVSFIIFCRYSLDSFKFNGTMGLFGDYVGRRNYLTDMRR